MPHASTWTRIWFGAGSGNSRSTSSKAPPGFDTCTARIIFAMVGSSPWILWRCTAHHGDAANYPFVRIQPNRVLSLPPPISAYCFFIFVSLSSGSRATGTIGVG